MEEKNYRPLKEELHIRQFQHDLDCYRQTNQASIDYGIKAQYCLFLLNGAAATALLAQSSNSSLQKAAIVFSSGALFAIVSLGASYVFNLVISETWRTPEPDDPDKPWVSIEPFKKKLSRNQFSRWRFRILIFSTLPAVTFIIGLIAWMRHSLKVPPLLSRTGLTDANFHAFRARQNAAPFLLGFCRNQAVT